MLFFLKHLDHADVICLLFRRIMDSGQITVYSEFEFFSMSQSDENPYLDDYMMTCL